MPTVVLMFYPHEGSQWIQLERVVWDKLLKLLFVLLITTQTAIPVFAQCDITVPFDQTFRPADLPATTQMDWEVPTSIASGEQIAVPAKTADGGRGAVYIFSKSSGIWSQTQKISAPDAAGGDYFGVSMCMTGDWLMVGGRVSRGGAVYIYKRFGATWNNVQTLAGFGGFFGYRLSTDGNYAIIGANGETSGSPPVRVFLRNGDQWQYVQDLPLPSGDVSYWGTRLHVVGDVALAITGLATLSRYHIYKLNNNAWQHQQTISDSTFQGPCYNVQVSPLRIAIPSGPDSGRTIRIYERSNTNSLFSLARTLVPPAGTSFISGAALQSNLIGICDTIGSFLVYDATSQGALPIRRFRSVAGPDGFAHAEFGSGDVVQLQRDGSGTWVIRASNIIQDCNSNGIWDAADICAGTSSDANQNGIPDICECTSPAVTIQPVSQSACVGSSVILSTSISGTAPTLQWRKNGVNIVGANSASLAISSVSVTDAGSYDCVATNSCGNVTTSQAVLTVNAQTSITAQPQAQALVPGATATFQVTATGAGLAYQWRRDGSALTGSARIGGVNSNTLTIATVAAGDQGLYDCVITGTCGNATSSAASLGCGPVITQQPQGGSVVGGSSITLSTNVLTAGATTYRWRKNGVNIFNSQTYSGALTSTLVINVNDPNDAGVYTVAVSNSCGSVVSGSAPVNVICLADFTRDGNVDGDDVIEFFAAWDAALPGGDINEDGSTDGDDVIALFDRWDRGC